MKAASLIAASLLVITAGLHAYAQETRPDGWRPLFDGKTLDGWEHVGPGKMIVEDGLIRTEGGMGLLWYTREKFGDCTLRVVYKTTDPKSNSGVFVRIDGPPKDEWHAVHHGYEVQIYDDADEFHRTGSIYSLSKSLAAPAKFGEWHTMDITLRGPRVIVTLDGARVQDFDPGAAAMPERKQSYEPERGPRPESGYIGLQNHDDVSKGKQVYFKEVAVRPNSPPSDGASSAPGKQSRRDMRRPLPDSIRAELDIAYAGADDVRQRLDLYLPKNLKAGTRLPLVAYIHGGGWAAGDKRDGAGLARALVGAGQYAVASIGYRLSSEAVWPAQIHDCKAAIRWLRANAAAHNLDPDHIGVMGESAGGHLGAMLGTSGGVAAVEGEQGEYLGVSSRVSCVVDQYGPTDFLMGSSLTDLVGFTPLDSPHSPVFQLMGGPVSKNKSRARDASPITYVSQDDAPFLLIHGTNDNVVPYVQSILLAGALKKSGVETILIRVDGGGHGGFGSPEISRRMRQFLDKHLLGKEESISAEPIQVGERRP